MGLFFGSFIFGYLGDKIGRKKTLVIAILTSCGGSLIGAFCGSSYVAYTVTRFVTAVGKFTKMYIVLQVVYFQSGIFFPREKTQACTYVG